MVGSLQDIQNRHCGLGAGTVTWKSGATYTGGLKNSLQHGKGAMNYNDGSTFKGTLKNGRPHGWGIIIYSNGYGFEGLFARGRPWQINVGAYVIFRGTHLHSDTEDESYLSLVEEV